MPQVLRPNDFSKEQSQSDFGTFEITRQVVYSLIVGLILATWLIVSYFNEGLFFKEAAVCSSLIFFLLLIKSKSTTKEE